MNGKDKCEQLKVIRKRIAKANDIPFIIKPCTHEGSCPGTCPACDAEVRYLERELEKRRRRGEKVILNGIAEDMFKEAIYADNYLYDSLDAMPTKGKLHETSLFEPNDYDEPYQRDEDDIATMGQLMPPKFDEIVEGKLSRDYFDEEWGSWRIKPSDVEEHLNSIIYYMDFTAENAGLALDNYYISCITKGEETIITLMGELSFSKNNHNLDDIHFIKGVIYDKNHRIEKEALYSIKNPFSGFDIFRLKWIGGTLKDWMEKSKIRLFVI